MAKTHDERIAIVPGSTDLTVLLQGLAVSVHLRTFTLARTPHPSRTDAVEHFERIADPHGRDLFTLLLVMPSREGIACALGCSVGKVSAMVSAGHILPQAAEAFSVRLYHQSKSIYLDLPKLSVEQLHRRCAEYTELYRYYIWQRYQRAVHAGHLKQLPIIPEATL